MENKKAQQTMGMPFSMIFAIFLIVVFIAIAFIAVGYFLDIGRTSGVGMFYNDLQNKVDDALSGQFSQSHFKIDLPSKITEVCFANLSTTITNRGAEYNAIKNYEVYNANIFLIPPQYSENMQWNLIKHIDIAKITKSQNPYCVSVSNGLTIGKGFYDKLVWIK